MSDERNTETLKIVLCQDDLKCNFKQEAEELLEYINPKYREIFKKEAYIAVVKKALIKEKNII